MPSFFYMQINDVVQDLESNRLLLTSTLIHEYCHFIQDITTNFGLSNIIKTCTILMDCAHQAGHNNQDIAIPMELCSKSAKFNSGKIDSLWGTFANIDEITIESYTIDCSNSSYKVDIQTSEGINLEFGVLAIIESMAMCLEEAMFEEPDESPDYPYNTCKKLISDIFPEFEYKPELAIALCDAALMYCIPSKVFIETLEQLKADNYSRMTMSDIYDFVFHNFNYPDLISVKVPDQNHYIFNANYIETCKSLNGLLGSDTYFDNEKKWILFRLEQAYLLRKDHPKFWVEVLEGHSLLQRQANLIAQFENIGFPVIFDKKCIMHVQDITERDLLVNHDLFIALNAVLEVLAEGEKRCCLPKHCRNNPNMSSIVNQECFSSPWNKSLNDYLCPFAKVWHRWKLTGKNVLEKP